MVTSSMMTRKPLFLKIWASRLSRVVRALKQDLDAGPVGRKHAPVRRAVPALVGIAKRGAPEARGPAEVRAVNHDDQLAVGIRTRLPGHRTIVSRVRLEC